VVNLQKKIMEALENDLEKIEGISDSELKREIAILLFEKDKISLRKAAKMAGLPWLDFNEILCERNLPTVKMTEEEFKTEISTVNSLLK
jgi:predicted HTH domain antitoxin